MVSIPRVPRICARAADAVDSEDIALQQEDRASSQEGKLRHPSFNGNSRGLMSWGQFAHFTAVAIGWILLHPSGAYVTFTQAGANLFAQRRAYGQRRQSIRSPGYVRLAVLENRAACRCHNCRFK